MVKRGNFAVGNFSGGGNLPGAIFRGQYIGVNIPEGNFLGGNLSRTNLLEGNYPGGNLPGGNFPSTET